VGAEDLVDQIKAGGALNFDRVIGHPSVMPILSQVARILGPRGLMPNPKVRCCPHEVTRALHPDVRLATDGHHAAQTTWGF
jgi:large subunit ribosomal protein L1